MNIRSLLLAASTLLLGLAAPGRADGFIVINRPVPGPVVPMGITPLEVSYHHVDVKIDGQICTTSVDEEFYNPNPQTLEGTYFFPVPKTAQIDKFTMQINGKETEAELLAADKARAIYEDIVRRERDPALLEYADRGVFRVRVYPIEGRGRKQVKISYTEVLKSDVGLVSYLYPLNTEKFSAAPVHDVSVRVDVKSNSALTSIYSPTHDVEIKRPDANHAVVGYEAKDVRPDTDFQLFFAPQKKDVSIDLLTSRAEADEDGYFLLLASPGFQAKAKHLAKDVTFVLDTSGSMASDDKLVEAKKALQYCLANLNTDDRFEIIRFSTESEQLFGKLTDASDAHVADAQKFVKGLKPEGSTAIFDALHQAMALKPEKNDRPYVVVFITDGQPTIGETDPDRIVAETDTAADHGTRIFCFGLGTDVNAHLLDRIAEHTRAVSDYVLPNEDLEVKVSNFFSKIHEPVLANVKLTFPEGVKVTKMYPREMPDLFQGDQLVLCGRYSGDGSGDCVIEGDAGGEHQSFHVPVTFAKQSDAQPFVPRLWASRRVAYLLDQIRLNGESAELKDEATALARKFGLVTPYTAYLIMEDERGRHVAEEDQLMGDLIRDKDAEKKTADAYDSFKNESSGNFGVNAARAQHVLRGADQSQSSLDSANLAAATAMNVPAPSVTAAPAAPGSGVLGGSSSYVMTKPVDADAGTRVMQYTQRTKYVAGRAFYQNGSEWVDSNVSEKNASNAVRVKFGTDAYFNLLAQHPEAHAWLAIGQNVKLLLADTVYDVYADAN